MVCLGLRLAQPNHLLYPPRNHLFVIFHDGITFERFKLEGWNFMWGLIMEIFSKNEPMEKFRPPQPPQPPYPPPKQSRWDNFCNFHPSSMKFCMEVTNGGIQLKWTYGIAGPCLNHPAHPKDKLWPDFDETYSLKWAQEILTVRNSVVDPDPWKFKQALLFGPRSQTPIWSSIQKNSRLFIVFLRTRTYPKKNFPALKKVDVWLWSSSHLKS